MRPGGVGIQFYSLLECVESAGVVFFVSVNDAQQGVTLNIRGMQLELFLSFFFSFGNLTLGEELFGFDKRRLRHGGPLGLVGRTLLGGGYERENESHP